MTLGGNNFRNPLAHELRERPGCRAPPPLRKHPTIGGIPPKELVGPLAGEDYLHTSVVGKLAYEAERDTNGIRKRFVLI